MLVLSEGLLIYLMPAEVAALAEDVAAPPSFRHWAVDIGSPGLLDMLKQRMGAAVEEAGAPFLFAPADGPAFFEPFGWQPLAVKSLLKTAAKLGRLPIFLRMIAMLPEVSLGFMSLWERQKAGKTRQAAQACHVSHNRRPVDLPRKPQ